MYVVGGLKGESFVGVMYLFCQNHYWLFRLLEVHPLLAGLYGYMIQQLVGQFGHPV